MRISLTSLLDGQCSELETEYTYMPDDSGVLLPDGISLREPIRVRCKITDKYGYMALDATAEAHYDTVCDRCLEPISSWLTFSISRLIETGAGGRGRDMQQDSGDDWDDDDVITVDNGAVDIDADITEAFALELPLYHLCRQDCPGLCPKCGKRLAEGDCGCSQKKEIDPRLAILQKLLEKPE